MDNIEWGNAANAAFNYYFRAVRKGETYDTAATWFRDEITEQVAAANLKFEDGWELNISPDSLQVVSTALASRLEGLNHEVGYEVNPEFYAAFLSFFGDVIYDRAGGNPDTFKQIQSFWDATCASRSSGG